MMGRCYSFAGIDFCVEIPQELMFVEELRLTSFRAKETIEGHRYRLCVVDELEEPKGNQIYYEPTLRVYGSENLRTCYLGSVGRSWQDGHTRVEHMEREHVVQLKKKVFHAKVGTKTMLAAIGVEPLVARAGGFILHASYIVYQGKAILFTAPSETGKSTQAELWRTLRGARIINGDRAVVRMVNGEASAWGLPYAGSSTYCENVTAPLAAIVYLEQAPTTTIRRLRGFEAFRCVWEGINLHFWESSDVELVSDTLTQVLNQVPVYKLACTPDESAVTALQQML